jgi:NlpC/P60 family putative phage cell wall peptidase
MVAKTQAKEGAMVANNLMLTREDVVREASSWIGTPYHHRACVKGAGADCGTFLIGVARSLGVVPADWMPEFYSVQWHLHRTEELYLGIILEWGARAVALSDVQPGDILVFRWAPEQPVSHAGIALADNIMIHTLARKGVQRSRLNAYYMAHIAGAYAWPGFPDE